MKFISSSVLAIMVVVSSVSLAVANDAHHASAPSQVTQAAAALVDGEVKKINKDAGKLTIKHGELKNLGMPPMTMVFRVKQPAMLDQVKAGDKIGFVAEKVNGQLTVIQLEARK